MPPNSHRLTAHWRTPVITRGCQRVVESWAPRMLPVEPPAPLGEPDQSTVADSRYSAVFGMNPRCRFISRAPIRLISWGVNCLCGPASAGM